MKNTQSQLAGERTQWILDEGMTVVGARRHYIKTATGNVAVGIIEGFTPEQARLIAVAPELLSAVKQLLTRIKAYAHEDTYAAPDEPEIVRAREAIAKAEGQL